MAQSTEAQSTEAQSPEAQSTEAQSTEAQSEPESENSLLSLFKALESDTDLDKLNSFGNSTPKFSLKNAHKICKIVDVYDGDTVRGVFEHNGQFNKWTIRMYGYDSPEMRPSLSLENRDEIKQKARESRDYLKGLILNKTIYLHCLDFDKYGRVLANIYTDGINNKSVNDHMVENNYGYAYFGGTKKK